ncbi:MAG: hypothetical protein ACFFDW_08390 [Candidatus Thorarchaeota archaeon]
MSYIEKSVYKYLKSVVTSGVKALFTRKFLIYTIFFLVVIVTTTLTSLVVHPSINLTIFNIPPEKMINYLFYFEIAFALAYILVGMFLSKTPIVLHVFLILLFTGGITTGFYFLDNFVVIAILCYVLFILWLLITIVSTFSFSKNLFGSRITGSILFMGKKEGGSALFSGISTPLILLCIGANGYILYQGIVNLSWIYITTASVGILAGGLIIFIIWSLAKKDDLFCTIVSFFYLLTNTHVIQLVIRFIKGDVNYISWLSVFVSVFFLLNSISKYYRKIQKLDADFQPRVNDEEIIKEEKKTKKRFWKLDNEIKEEFFISDVFKFITDRGVILLVLGFALAYHSMLLQIGFNNTNIANIFTGISGGIVQSGHCITMIFSAIVVLISIIFYYSSKRFRAYTSPQIFRFNFLPPFEDVEKFIVDAKAGNIDWKILARDATVSLAKKGLSSTARLSLSVKDQSIEYAKKGYGIVKEKTKQIGQKIKDKVTDEDIEDDDF